MKLYIKYLFIIVLFIGTNLSAQSKLVLNGGILSIANGANLVVNDPNADAVVRNSGHIISEGESNSVVWNISTTSGSYIVPFGLGAADYIPVSFTKTSGTGAGYFKFSTYNSSSVLPTGVGHLNNSSGSDNSAHVLDRFWQVNAVNYTVKPDLTNVVFTYLDAEHLAVGNTIDEASLQAQRWNSDVNKWGDMHPAGVADIGANNVLVNAVSGSDLYEWWTLVDFASPLPVTFVNVLADCYSDGVLIEWSTASEINNDFFTVEKSNDDGNWEKVINVTGRGNSSEVISYSVTDNSKSGKYYRVKQTDFNGESSYSETVVANCGDAKEMLFNVYPNPSSGIITVELNQKGDHNKEVFFKILNMFGETIEEFSSGNDRYSVDLTQKPKGVYMIVLNDQKGRVVIEKIVLQ